MRDFKGMKRQRGRNRNGGGGGGGGNRPQHNTNRAFDSNGPDSVKVRGAAQHVYEKYQQFARDASTAGDRVLAENYLQHAEHYFRVMRAMQPLRPLSEIIGRDNFVSGYDIDFEDESGANEALESDGEGERQERSEGRGEERPREDFRQGEQGQRDDRPRYDRGQNDRPSNDRPRDERSGEDRSRDDRPREDRAARGYRDERPRFNRDERAPRFERSEGADVVPQPVTASPETARGPEPAGILRADDGETSHAPAFLQVRPIEPRDDGAAEPRRARRRRGPRVSENGEGASDAPEPIDEG
ncbi:MAG TPA: DUF4167 domain-containing protein [Caulobacteraceae bacterium]|nr:DUF4167 domain-containing protein [Caulobacteraceae bacterium]